MLNGRHTVFVEYARHARTGMFWVSRNGLTPCTQHICLERQGGMLIFGRHVKKELLMLQFKSNLLQLSPGL